MLKLKDVYTLPFTRASLTDWCFRAQWVPEISELEFGMSGDTLAAMEADGRLQVRQLADEYIDGDRCAEMHTIWFDGEPVFLVQNSGRGGCEYLNRWITNAERYYALVHYLRTKVPGSACDIVDPDTQVFEEEIFCFYGFDFTEKFGYKLEPRTKGFTYLGEGYRIVVGANRDYLLIEVSKSVKEVPTYLRRNECVMKQVGALTNEELDRNIHLKESTTDNGTRYYWYVDAPRPENGPVLSI